MNAFFSRALNWWPSILVIIFVLYLTCWPDPLPEKTIPVFPGADKLVHAIMFGGIVGALDFDYYRKCKQFQKSVRYITLIFAVALGGITELIQSIDSIGRSCDIFDFCADIMGALIAFYSAPPVIRSLFRSSHPNKRTS